MKKAVLILLCCAVSATSMAQTVEYQTFIYTSSNLADDIRAYQEEHANESSGGQRSLWGDMLGAGLNAASGIAAGYVSSFVDIGVNAIASLITRNSRLKEEWEKTVAAENAWTTSIATVSEMNDFYTETSFDGPMDPQGMRFDGIGCLRKEGADTVFYISCHVDRSKLYRIINHSKFELVLDTLIISPLHSNLPNTNLDIPFSFEERKNFNLAINIKLTSSWINELTLLQKDTELGEFSINIPVEESALDEKGFLRYVRKEGEPAAYTVVGESFIVPRSYMGYRDENDEYRNSWGTGEYKFAITLAETCDITDAYRANWKSDRKRRKHLTPHEGFFAATWKVVSSQKWNEITQSWVITTLKAPAGVLSNDMIEGMRLKSPAPQPNSQPKR